MTMRIVYKEIHDGHKVGKWYFTERSLARRLCEQGKAIPYQQHLDEIYNAEQEKIAVKEKADAKRVEEEKEKVKKIADAKLEKEKADAKVKEDKEKADVKVEEKEKDTKPKIKKAVSKSSLKKRKAKK